MLAARSWASGLQNCEKLISLVYKLSSLGYFVRGAPNTDTVQTAKIKIQAKPAEICENVWQNRYYRKLKNYSLEFEIWVALPKAVTTIFTAVSETVMFKDTQKPQLQCLWTVPERAAAQNRGLMGRISRLEYLKGPHV